MTYIPPRIDEPNKPTWTFLELKNPMKLKEEKWRKEVYGDFAEAPNAFFRREDIERRTHPNPIPRDEPRDVRRRDILPFDRRIDPEIARRIRREGPRRRTGGMDIFENMILAFNKKPVKRIEEKHNWRKEGF